MSFNFDFSFCSSYQDRDLFYSGLETPPLTPLYSTSLPSSDHLPLLHLPLLDLPPYPSPPATPALTPSNPSSTSPQSTYPYLPSTPVFTPASYPTLPEADDLHRSSITSYSTPSYSSPPLVSYSPAMNTSTRSNTQRYCPYQRSTSTSRKINKRSPLRPSPNRPSTPVAFPTPQPSTSPSLLEQAACLVLQPTPTSPPTTSPPSHLSSPPAEETSPTSLSPDPLLKPLARRRKARVELTDHQKTQLELVFSLYKYLGHDVRLKVAEQVGLPEKTVLYWFQNRRAKERKAKKNKPSS
ncbi:hypothetical protein ACHWQZ_G007601 [Mnemiopsis leidyi]